MFDINIWEFGVIGVVALIVLGPERLPKVARTAGHLFGRLQRYVANVKSDIAREMDASEIAKVKEEVESAARSFETTVRSHTTAIESDAQTLAGEFEKEKVSGVSAPTLGAPPTAPATMEPVSPPSLDAPAVTASATQADILAAQEASLAPPAPTSRLENGVLRFDLGIEPPRRAAQTARE